VISERRSDFQCCSSNTDVESCARPRRLVRRCCGRFLRLTLDLDPCAVDEQVQAALRTRYGILSQRPLAVGRWWLKFRHVPQSSPVKPQETFQRKATGPSLLATRASALGTVSFLCYRIRAMRFARKGVSGRHRSRDHRLNSSVIESCLDAVARKCFGASRFISGSDHVH